MASRRFKQSLYSLQTKVAVVYGHVDVGVAGAITTYAGRGITTVTKLGAGRFRVTLADAYMGLLSADIIPEIAANNVDLTVQIEAIAVTAAGGQTIDFRTKTAGVSTDPANGDSVWFSFHLLNSGVDPVI